jgi:hypothetical protein
MTGECGMWETADRVLKALFGTEREEMKWEWKTVGKENNRNFY